MFVSSRVRTSNVRNLRVFTFSLEKCFSSNLLLKSIKVLRKSIKVFTFKIGSLYLSKLCSYLVLKLLRYYILLFHTMCVLWYIPFITIDFDFSIACCICFFQNLIFTSFVNADSYPKPYVKNS